jgi:hypothetical protein
MVWQQAALDNSHILPECQLRAPASGYSSAALNRSLQQLPNCTVARNQPLTSTSETPVSTEAQELCRFNALQHLPTGVPAQQSAMLTTLYTQQLYTDWLDSADCISAYITDMQAMQAGTAVLELAVLGVPPKKQTKREPRTHSIHMKLS